MEVNTSSASRRYEFPVVVQRSLKMTVGGSDDNYMFNSCKIVKYGEEPREKIGCNEHNPGARVIELMKKILPLERRVYRNRYVPEAYGAGPPEQSLLTVLKQHRNAFLFADTDLVEKSSEEGRSHIHVVC
jgi:hypothetical protein